MSARDGVLAARPTIDAFLDAELASRGLDESALALVGFSQGTMLGLHVGLRRKKAPRAILGYSGLLVTPSRGSSSDPSQTSAHHPRSCSCTAKQTT